MNLKEFAARISLSQTTVSRAMSGYPEVKPETRQRVLDAAETLGYRPNISAQRLTTGRAGAIGIVLQGGGRFGPHSSATLDTRGIAVDPALVGHGAFTDETGFGPMQSFFALPAPPTAVIAGSMMSALVSMLAIRIAGLIVGEDVSVIAHDDVFPI